MAKLTAAAVAKLFEACEFKDSDLPRKRIVVEGIIAKRAMHRGRLQAHQAEIMALLAELPEQFRRTVGGGWSFLNACEDRRGNQWTGMQSIMEQLVMLGLGIGKVEFMLPRERWGVFPGRVPYFMIDM